MRIIEPATKEEWKQYIDLRYEMLRKEWDQPYSSTTDDEEDISIHLLMLDDKNEAIATGRLQLNGTEEGQIRSMAVRADQQGKGLGKAVVKHIEEIAKEKKLKSIVLDGREQAVPFYEKLGYRVIEESYLLYGMIQHYRMRKDL